MFAINDVDFCVRGSNGALVVVAIKATTTKREWMTRPPIGEWCR